MNDFRLNRFFILAGLAAILVGIACAPGDTDGGDGNFATTCSAGTCTGSVPSSSTDGVGLSGYRSFRVIACADLGQTLGGAGTLDAYYYSPTAALWTRGKDVDKTVNLTSTSCIGAACRCRTFGDDEVMVGRGRFKPVPNGVTVSSGNLTIYVEVGR